MVFSMASNRRNKPAMLPTQELTRPSKPLKKHPHSTLMPSIPATKKARLKAAPQPPTCISPPLRPIVLLLILLLPESA